MIRQNLLCVNSKINGCQETVSQRGKILCEICTENRKNISLNKREYDIDQLMNKYLQTEQELSKYKTMYEQDINKIRLNELKNSQIAIDNEKLIIDNKQLEVINQNLNLQLELLTKENQELSKKLESQKQIVPQTARGGRPSKIPELKRNI